MRLSPHHTTHTHTLSHSSHTPPHTHITPGFHTGALYPELRSAVRPLVALLRHDPDDKIRANAAGALGNLVRNSGELVPELLQECALQALVGVVAAGVHELQAAGGREPPPSSPLKTALFSLGNMCTYRQCVAELVRLGVLQAIEPLAGSADQNLVRFAVRLQKKINAHSA